MADNESLEKINALVAQHHDETLLKENMVVMIWGDGEITTQKGGDLLWQRQLICLRPPLGEKLNIKMPVRFKHSSFAVVPSEAIAAEIRELMQVHQMVEANQRLGNEALAAVREYREKIQALLDMLEQHKKIPSPINAIERYRSNARELIDKKIVLVPGTFIDKLSAEIDSEVDKMVVVVSKLNM